MREEQMVRVRKGYKGSGIQCHNNDRHLWHTPVHVACRYGVAAYLGDVTYHAVAVADSAGIYRVSSSNKSPPSREVHKVHRSGGGSAAAWTLAWHPAGRNHTSVRECAALIALVRPVQSRPLRAHWLLSSLPLLTWAQLVASPPARSVASVIVGAWQAGGVACPRAGCTRRR